MNVLKAVLHDLKFLFEDACGIFADSDVRFIHATLNNFFKVSKVIVETECYLSFFTGNLEKLCKIAIKHITSIFPAAVCILAGAHEIFVLRVDYLQLINIGDVRNCVSIIATNNLSHNHLK